MNENYNQNNTDTAVKRGFLSWLDNFWYHYKWHTIISLFLVFAITICTVQSCQKTSYDIRIMYAGSHTIKRQSEGADIPEYTKVLTALKAVTPDFDDNGKSDVALLDLHVLTNAEMQESDDYNATRVLSDRETLTNNLGVSDYYLCFFSPSVYEEYMEGAGELLFASLAPYVNDGSGLEYYDESAVYLSSTGFYKLAGVSGFPEDTLICIRKINGVSSHFNSKNAKKQFSRAEDVLRNILNY